MHSGANSTNSTKTDSVKQQAVSQGSRYFRYTSPAPRSTVLQKQISSNSNSVKKRNVVQSQKSNAASPNSAKHQPSRATTSNSWRANLQRIYNAPVASKSIGSIELPSINFSNLLRNLKGKNLNINQTPSRSQPFQMNSSKTNSWLTQ